MILPRTLAGAFAILLLATPLLAQQTADAEGPSSFAEAFTLAQAAYAAGDWEALRRTLAHAESFSPDHPLVLYHLARAEGLLGNSDGAMARLARLAEFGGTARDIASDTAFALLRGTRALNPLLERLREAAAPVVASDSAFVLPDPDFIPEGITYDPASETFFVGSLNGGDILRIGSGGSSHTFAANAAGASDGRLGRVIGLRVDPAKNLLWAATLVVDSAAPSFQRGIGGWASLRSFELSTGRLVASHPAPDSSSAHLLNDIALAPNGDLYVSDSEGDALFMLASGEDALEEVVDAPPMDYPNGLAVVADGTSLYVAHSAGISAIPLGSSGTGAVPLLRSLAGPTSGIDGLYVCRGDLLAIQSLLDTQRVVRFALDQDGRSITDATVLEHRHPAHDAATTGAIAGHHFYYIANAQLRRLLPSGSIDPEEAPTRSVILRLPLDESCT